MMDNLTICVDFDGTCVDHCFPEIGFNAPNAVFVLEQLSLKGHRLILWTMRSHKYLDDAVSWYAKHKIPLYGINENPTQKEWTHSPKCYANIYIDDAAFNAPLIKPEGFNRPCIDWLVVAKHFDIRI